MADINHRQLPVEILTMVVWQVCAGCLDVLLWNEDLACDDGHIVSTTFTSLLRLSYAARNVTLEVLSQTLGIPIDNSGNLPRLSTKPWARLEFFRAEIYDKRSTPRSWLEHPPAQLSVVSTYLGLVTLHRIWRLMGTACRPPFCHLVLPGLQEWDKHMRKAWPECPVVFRAALRDRVADEHGRAVIMEKCLVDISKLNRVELIVLLKRGVGAPDSGSEPHQDDYSERVGQLLDSLSKIQKAIVAVQDLLAEFPPSVPLADLMHHEWRSFLCICLLSVVRLHGTGEPLGRCREVARELLSIFGPKLEDGEA